MIFPVRFLLFFRAFCCGGLHVNLWSFPLSVRAFCFQKAFHIGRYIDRYVVLFCCTCARAHFSLLIVQLVVQSI